MKFNTFLACLPEYERSGEQNVFSQRSDLWSHIVDQRLDLEAATEAEALSAFTTFLAPGSHQSTGISDWARQINEGLCRFLESRLDPALIAQYPAPTTGSPQMLTLHRQEIYTAHAWNLIAFKMLSELLEQHGPQGPLDVVEIGAGYGSAALNWIRSGRVRSYVIIDLIDNLPNSGFFLRDNLPDWSFELVRIGEPLELREKTIYALCPSHIAALENTTFDMALNTDSLGEMPRETARNYVSWINDHLRPGGVFLSKNGHCRAKNHTTSYSDYGYQAFQLRHLGYTDFCSSALDDFSHVTVLEKTKPEGTPDWSPDRLHAADALANAFRCGFGADLTPLLDRFCKDALTAQDLALIACFKSFFETQRLSQQDDSAPAPVALLSVLQYLAGLGPKKAGRTAAQTYLDLGQSHMGRVYAYLALLKAGIVLDETALQNEDAMVQHFVTELRDELGHRPVKRWIVLQIRAENILKKISPGHNYAPSTLMKIKNLAMNIREGRRPSFYRGE